MIKASKFGKVDDSTDKLELSLEEEGMTSNLKVRKLLLYSIFICVMNNFLRLIFHLKNKGFFIT